MKKNIFKYLFLLVGSPAFAAPCATEPSDILFQSCAQDAELAISFHPDATGSDARDLLQVTGTYSSGDRFGVEGLAINKSAIVSSRFQGWDGLMIVQNGEPSLYNVSSTSLDGKVFNLKTQPDRKNFIELAKQLDVSVIQSHLLITDGVLDVTDVENARQFVRRMFYTVKDKDGGTGWGVYETNDAVTLYQGAVEIQEALNPQMVLNLDMGAYNYCRQKVDDKMIRCGDLFVEEETLTNVLSVRSKVLSN